MGPGRLPTCCSATLRGRDLEVSAVYTANGGQNYQLRLSKTCRADPDASQHENWQEIVFL